MGNELSYIVCNSENTPNVVVILVYLVLNNYALDNEMILYDVKNIIIVRLWTYFPIDCGLWKFNGLPGLIMKAVD